MLEVFKQWYVKNFSDPNAVTLIAVITFSVILLAVFGHLLMPVFVAIVFAFLLEWPVRNACKMGVSRIVATSVVIFGFVTTMTIVFVLAIPVIWQQSLSLIKELPEMMAQVKHFINALPDYYPNLDPAVITNLMGNVDAKALSFLEQAVETVMSSATDVVALLIYLILVPLMVFFMLKDKQSLLQGFDKVLPEKRRLIVKVGNEMNEQIINYIRGKMMEIIIIGGSSYILFALMDLRYAAVLGLLVGLSVLVPYIGAAVVTVPVVAVALFQFGLSSDFYAIVIAYGIIQALDGNLLVPILFSEAVDLNPVYIIVAVLFFGGLWGFWGVFFAIPLASLVKAVISAWSEIGATEQQQGE